MAKDTYYSCIAGEEFHFNLEENNLVTLSAFLVFITLAFALVSFGNNI